MQVAMLAAAKGEKVDGSGIGAQRKQDPKQVEGALTAPNKAGTEDGSARWIRKQGKDGNAEKGRTASDGCGCYHCQWRRGSEGTVDGATVVEQGRSNAGSSEGGKGRRDDDEGND
ncbi:hypothetical protein GW17_00006709 [Ensete ventricosum]|nr:hypothetical protein GW17_00006709 [Ensete ventricosum]